MTDPHVFRIVQKAVCWTCNAEWFGRTADEQARRHAEAHGHEVTTEVLTRTTYNASSREFLPQMPDEFVAPAPESPARVGPVAMEAPRQPAARLPYAGHERRNHPEWTKFGGKQSDA